MEMVQERMRELQSLEKKCLSRNGHVFKLFEAKRKDLS